MDKKTLRNIVKLKRNEMHLKNEICGISKKIVDNIKNSFIYKNSINIAIYYPIKNEISLLELLNDKSKVFFLPKCVGKNLNFVKYDSDLYEGAYSIPEPYGESVDSSILDVILVPALCCNKNYYRIGWGKGFYDRFFYSNNVSAKKIIVCPECFIFDDFVEDDFDYQCDGIVTESNFYNNLLNL